MPIHKTKQFGLPGITPQKPQPRNQPLSLLLSKETYDNLTAYRDRSYPLVPISRLASEILKIHTPLPPPPI